MVLTTPRYPNVSVTQEGVVSEDVRKALSNLVNYVERNTCQHEETHRGGFLWTICDECGRRWADDQGGFVPYFDPPELAQAKRVLFGNETMIADDTGAL